MITRLVPELGLNGDRLRRDMTSPEVTSQIEREIALAKQLGVTGVPTFFINGHKTVGSRDLDFCDKIVRRLLSGGKR